MCTLATLEVGSLQWRAFSFTAGLSTVVTAWVTQFGSTYALLNMSCFVYSHLCGYVQCMSVDVCKSVGSVGVYLCVWMGFTVQCQVTTSALGGDHSHALG